ncbi:MAG: M20/M25/M40 family metallo-hydrolase [Bacillota bacterium]
MTTELEKKLIGDALTSDNAYQLVVELCERFGSRFAGTQAEQDAAGYLAARLRDYGLKNVTLLPFEYKGWRRGGSKLELTSSEAVELDCIGLPYSPVGEIEGELVDLGLGSPEDFVEREGQLKGKIVLVSAKRPIYARDNMHRRDKYLRAVEAGAAGFIWMREVGGHLAETGGLPHDAQIPAVGVSRETGFKLQRRIKQAQVFVRLQADHEFYRTTSYNVYGTLEGQQEDQKKLVAGAHYDGHDVAVGALDNASGTAVVLEAVRLLAEHDLPLQRSIDVVLFAAEEVELVGSTAFVQEQANLEDYIFMLNSDGGPGRPGAQLGVALQGWPELQALFRDIFKQMEREDLLVGVSPGSHSDMHSFSEENVPSGYLAALEEVSTGRNWGHTRADTLDKVEKEKLREDSLLFARLLLHLSQTEGWPGDN